MRDGSLVTGDKNTRYQAPGIWDAARKLWESGHRRPAVPGRGNGDEGAPEDKLGRHDLVDSKLLQEAFSASPPEPGWPRLQVPGDPRNPTVASRQPGTVSLGLECTWVIRNPTRWHVGWSPDTIDVLTR